MPRDDCAEIAQLVAGLVSQFHARALFLNLTLIAVRARTVPSARTNETRNAANNVLLPQTTCTRKLCLRRTREFGGRARA